MGSSSAPYASNWVQEHSHWLEGQGTTWSWKQFENSVGNIALRIWLFDLLMLSDISSITAYLLYSYADNAKTVGR